MVSLCTYCSSTKITPIIAGNSNSKSVAVKGKVALCVDKVLEKHNYELHCLKDNPKLVNVMSSMIVDGSSEVRCTIKEVFLQILDNNL